MPKAEDQDLFEPAYCRTCKQRADLRLSYDLNTDKNPYYTYWCCGTHWVVSGSKMDVVNKLNYVEDE